MGKRGEIEVRKWKGEKKNWLTSGGRALKALERRKDSETSKASDKEETGTRPIAQEKWKSLSMKGRGGQSGDGIKSNEKKAEGGPEALLGGGEGNYVAGAKMR